MGKLSRSGVFESRFQIRVDYRLGFRGMLAAARLHEVDPRITEEQFPLLFTRGVGFLNFVLVYFEDNKLPPEVIEQYLSVPPREPARIEHILALASAAPEIQRVFDIPALGATWKRTWEDRKNPGKV